MGSTDYVECVVKRIMAKSFFVNLKHGTHIKGLDAGKEMLLNRIIKQLVERTTVRATVRLIETDVNRTTGFSIHFATTFKFFHVASI